jgi:hypothetical protein
LKRELRSGNVRLSSWKGCYLRVLMLSSAQNMHWHV